MDKAQESRQESRRKGWVEAEYERHKRMRRKSSGNCILEVKDSDTGETTHLLFRTCDMLMECSAAFDKIAGKWCDAFCQQPCAVCRLLLAPAVLIILLMTAATTSLLSSAIMGKLKKAGAHLACGYGPKFPFKLMLWLICCVFRHFFQPCQVD